MEDECRLQRAAARPARRPAPATRCRTAVRSPATPRRLRCARPRARAPARTTAARRRAAPPSGPPASGPARRAGSQGRRARPLRVAAAPRSRCSSSGAHAGTITVAIVCQTIPRASSAATIIETSAMNRRLRCCGGCASPPGTSAHLIATPVAISRAPGLRPAGRPKAAFPSRRQRSAHFAAVFRGGVGPCRLNADRPVAASPATKASHPRQAPCRGPTSMRRGASYCGHRPRLRPRRPSSTLEECP